eukprot:998825-Prymnesium_polylepis.2
MRAKRQLKTFQEEGGRRLAAKSSSYCRTINEEHADCEVACGYDWVANHAGDVYQQSEGGEILQRAGHACHSAVRVTNQTMYCRMVAEHAHAGCSVACGKTWSTAEHRCVTAKATPKEQHEVL